MKLVYNILRTCRCDGMVDVVDSKSTAGDSVPVRVRSPAPNQYNPNQIFPRGKWVRIICLFQEIRTRVFPQRRTHTARIQTKRATQKETYINREQQKVQASAWTFLFSFTVRLITDCLSVAIYVLLRDLSMRMMQIKNCTGY